MTQKQTLLIILGCAAAAALVWGMRWWWAASTAAGPGEGAPAGALSRQAGSVDAVPLAGPPAQPAAHSVQPPAWRTPPALPQPGELPAAAERAALAQRAERLSAISREFEALRRIADPDPGKASALLQQLEAASGTSTLSGVRLDVLRHNLDVVTRMRPLLLELQALQGSLQPGKAPDAATSRSLQEKIAQLQAMQKQLRTDVLDESALRSAAGGAP